MRSTEKKTYAILYFLDYGIGFGGAANTLLNQAVLMKKAGHGVTVFFSDYFGNRMSDEYREICLSLGIDYQWATYRIASQPEDIDIVCIDNSYEQIRDIVKSYAPDVLHSVQINACAELVSRELGIPHIMNIYPLMPEFFSLGYMDVFPHYHLCDSWHYAKQWHKYLHTDSKCIRTAAGSNNDGKARFGGDVTRYICVGSVYKEKNQLAVIRAFHEALKRGIHGKLTICGYCDTSYGMQCAQYIEGNNLQGSISLKGFCTKMDDEYGQNDILVCGSTRESYPNAVSEAMANGLVVLSTPVGGVPEVIVDGENGYLANGYRKEEIAEKMLQIQNDIRSGKIKKVIVNSKKAFEDNHSFESVGKKLAQYYRYVIDDYEKESQNERNLLRIENVRGSFREIITKFSIGKSKFASLEDVSLKLWYLHHIMDIVKDAGMKRKKFYIWGAGRWGILAKEMTDVFFEDISISGFIDSKKNGEFCGYAIYKPDEALAGNDAVVFIAAVNGQDEMIRKLEMMNKRFNMDYFILAERVW